MELSRQEYPAMLSSLQPASAVHLLKDRLRRIQTVNAEIAEWIQERRKAEDLYAQSLQKLARKGIVSEAQELGTFYGPWRQILTSTLSAAKAHEQFSKSLESEVERPLRSFATSNREYTSMKDVEANLHALAKHVETAEEKADKLRKRGQKAAAAKVSEAASAVERTNADWDSQAPYVFEQLQLVDETRLNQLRDALTQYHTLEADCAQKTMQHAQESLATLLDFKTEDEVRHFAQNSTQGKSKISRTSSRQGLPSTPNNGTFPSTPSIVTEHDAASVRTTNSGGAPSIEKPGRLGLKRLGTVLRGRSNRNSHMPYLRAGSPDNSKARSSERLSTPRNHPITPVTPSREANSVNTSPRTESRGNVSTKSASNHSLAHEGIGAAVTTDVPKQNGNSDGLTPKNSIEAPQPPMTVPLVPSLAATADAPKTDEEGYSIPPPNHDALPGFGLSDDVPDEQAQPQFKVEIRNDVIHEEEEEADAALSKVASTLRAQNTISRKNRGRRDGRDVRNTMFFPAAPPPLPQSAPRPESPVTTSIASVALGVTAAEPVPSLTSSSPPLTPVRMPRPPALTPDQTGGSDTQSVRSARSITSLAGATIKHRDLTAPGLSASLIQALSISFEHGQPTKAVVIGEVAFCYNPPTPTSQIPLTQLLRLRNFSSLEKIAPNPTLLTPTVNTGEYTLSIPSLPPGRTSLAMRFQLHIPPNPPPTLAPVILHPMWKVEPHQASLILNYRPNPACALPSPIVLKNVIFVTGVEGVKSSSCQSKPVGVFSREKGRLAWKFETLTLNADGPAEKLLARWSTDGMARVAPIEMRWEVEGGWSNVWQDEEGEVGPLGIEKWEEGEKDPFGDDSEAEPQGRWEEVGTERSVVSGKFIAV